MLTDPILAIVIPVYNEEQNLPALLRDWRPVFHATGAPYRILFIDDGSTDGSLALLQALRSKDPAIEVYTQKNAGHGAAILRGYRMAIDGKAEWIFQIDSDHQLDPAVFDRLWAHRGGSDLLLGQRMEKQASASRRLLSVVATSLVRVLFATGVKDFNCPYRLMRGSLLEQALIKIPPDSFAPNILLTAWYIHKKSRIFTTVVEHRKTDNRPSRMSGYILRGALRSFWQTIRFRLRG